ncbi:MAG: RICIN domain-containing protein, partial [Oscillospiraceae bacterium]|nr:RICIN domain-containing protein [Oscillospiraceae bacterium]
PGNTTDNMANKLLSSSKVQNSVQNYVVNPSFNSDALSGFGVWHSNSADTSTAVKDTSYGHFSAGSLKITRPSNYLGQILVNQRIDVPSGYYTVSAFVSTNGSSLSVPAGVLGAQLGYVTPGNVYETRTSEPIQKTNVGEWVRRSVTIYVPEGSFIKVICGFSGAAVGTVWIDDIQIEKGHGVSSFNLIQNPSFFNGISNWNGYGNSFSVATSTLSGFDKQVTVTPESDGDCSIYQGVSFNGKIGDVFSAGAWIKASSVPTALEKNLTATKIYANCKLRIQLLSGGTVKKTVDKEYNPNISSWQFVSTKIIADTAFDTVRLTVLYEDNCNTISVTGMYVLAEEYGESYTYDSQGNIISSADVTSSISSYGFSSGNLSSIKQPTGSNTLYSHFDNNLVSLAYSTNGQRYQYAYNGNGDATSVICDSLPLAVYIEDGENYYILNSASGMALDSASHTLGSDCHLWAWSSTNVYQQWTAVEQSNGNYSFKLTSKPEYALDISNGSAASNVICQIYTYSGNAPQQFILEEQEDGSFVIKTASSSGTCAVDGQPNPQNELKNASPIHQMTYDVNDPHQKWYFIPVDEVNTDNRYLQATAQYNTASGNFQTQSVSVDNIVTSYSYNTTNGQLNSVTTGSQTTNYSYVSNTNQLASV